MSQEQQRAVIIESLKAAEVPDSLIHKNIDKVMEGAQPGKNCTTMNRASTQGRAITKGRIAEAARQAGRVGAVSPSVAAQLGASAVIVGGATYGYNLYLNKGEQIGTELATRIGVGRTLQLLGQQGELPNVRTWSYIKDNTIEVEEYPFTHMHIVSVITIKGWLQP